MSTSKSVGTNDPEIESASIGEQPEDTCSSAGVSGAEHTGEATVPNTAGKRKKAKLLTAEEYEKRNARLSERRALSDALLKLMYIKLYKLPSLRGQTAAEKEALVLVWKGLTGHVPTIRKINLLVEGPVRRNRCKGKSETLR